MRPLFSSFSIPIGKTKSSRSEEDDFAPNFRQAATVGERAEVVVQALAKKLARSLSMVVDDVDSSKPLFDYGVDSLVAVEIRNWIGKEFSADVAVFDIMGARRLLPWALSCRKRAGS